MPSRVLGQASMGSSFMDTAMMRRSCKEARIERCDALAAVTDLDNANIMACEVASKLYHVPRVVARVYNPESVSTFQELGLEYVFGTNIVAQTIMDKIVQGHGRHLSIRGDVEIVEFIAGPKIENKRLIDIQIPNEFRICLVTRQGKTLHPLEGNRAEGRRYAHRGGQEQCLFPGQTIYEEFVKCMS